MANGIRAEYAKRAEANTIRQDDLFGADETFNTEMALRAKYAGDQIARINLDLRALKIVSGKQSGNVAAKDSLLKKYNIKGPDDAPGIERAIQELETLHHRWQHYYTDAELSKEADAFVKKSLRLDPEDQPPVVIVQPADSAGRPEGAPEQTGSGAAPHQPGQASNPPSLQTSGGNAADDLPLGSPAAQPTGSAGRPEGAPPASPVSPASPVQSSAPATQRSAEPPENAVRRKIQDVQVRIGEPWMNEGLVNGPRFTDTAKPIDKKTQRNTLRENVKTPMRNDWMGDKHGSTSIASNVNAGKITEWEATENPHAHKYAAENLNELWAKARVAICHIDKDIARRAEEQGLEPKDVPQKHFLRAYTPFVFQGKLYVAVISKRDIDHDVPGVHAIEVDAVIDADRIPDFLSGPTGTEQIDGWTHNSETQSAPTDTVAKPDKKVKPPSALTNDLLDYQLGNVKYTQPKHLDGSPYTRNELAADILADVQSFADRVAYIADHRLQPIDTDDGGRFTMGEGVTVEVSDGFAAVAGLAGKAPADVAKVLDAVQAQLPPNVTISTDAQSPARRPEGAPPESPASPESPARPSGGNAAAPLANQAHTANTAAPDRRPEGAPPFSVLRSPFSIANGIDAVSIAVYPNGGRVPVAGSPAATAGTLPLSLPHAVQLFHLLTGKLPGVVAQKNKGPRNALGWYLPKTADIFVRAQLFGLIDQSDLTTLKEGLTRRGFFRHEDPAWCATQTKDSIRREKNLSNQKLEKAADLLIRRRTRAGVHQGAAAKVMAHELWHAISASGGVPPRDHGNLLGQIYNLKKCMAKALPENAFATDDVLRQEAKDFIAWWRGLGHHEPYFDQPHEAYAEMGAAFFLDPEAVRERAPTYYNAMLDGLRNYPQAFDALAAIRDQHAAGGDLDAFQRRLQATWQAAHDARLRKLRDEVGKPTRDERKARIVQLLWNRHAPVMMILQRAQKDVRARLRQDLKDGNITQADHDAKIKELDEDLLDLRHHTLLFTHRHGPSKLFLADIWGKIGQQADALGVSMNDLNLYLHLRRVEELKGRATALGIDPPTARLMLNKFFDRLGYSKVRAIARLAKTFHAVWQHAILENPDVVAMLGPDKIAELKRNAHYITMRHVPTPEELQAATVAWEKTKRAKSGGDPLDPIVRELLGHKAYTSGIYGANAHTGVASALKRLQGSLRQTESPLTATAETGLAILEAAQRNALTVSLVRALKAVGFDEIAVLKPTDDVITNDRIGTVQYMENGKRVTLAAPRSVVDALSGAPFEIPYLTAATRFLSAGFTTNNPGFIIPAALRDLDSLYVQMPGMKRGFAQWCAAYANIIPGVGPLSYVRAVANLGNWVNWSAQFIPPHVMKHISQTPIGRLLYGQNTVAYWTSVGAKIARIIQHMDFEGTLRQAHEARLAGDDAKAEALEYCATMARHALEDGVLLTYNQQLADDYLKGGLQRLFDKYHLKYDDDRRYLPIPAKIAKRTQDYRDTLRQRLQRANAVTDPKKRMAALAAVAASPLADLYRTTIWEPSGFLSEYQSMMVKLAGWAYLHHESANGTLPPDSRSAIHDSPAAPAATGEAAPSPLASPAPAIPAGAHIRTKEEQAALRDSLIPAPPPQGTAPLPDDATPQQAFQAFENTLAGKRFITPLGETVSFNEGHFGRVTCAGNPQGSDDPAKRKGFIAGYPSAQAARQALREGKVNADQIQGYQSSRAALIPLIPDIVQHPQYILGHEGAQLFVKRYDIGNGRDILAVFRKFGNDLRPVSLYPTEIHGGKLKESRVLFAENAANLRWSAGIAETGTPPPDTTTIPQSAPFVNPLANPAPGQAVPGAAGAQPTGRGAASHQPGQTSNPPSLQTSAYDASRRRQIALYAADRAGDPNFANKGILLGQLETFFTGFLNARMKGLSRTAARIKEAPGEFSLKALALLAPSLAQTVIIGGYATKILRDLLFDGQEPDEDQQNTAGGILYNNVKWMQDALKNVSPYTRLNYVVNPRVSNETSRLGGKVWGSKPLRFRKKMWTYAESGPWEEWILKFGSWGGWGGGRCRGVGIVLYYRHELDEATVCEEGVAAGVSGGGRDVGGGGLPNPAQGVGGGHPA